MIDIITPGDIEGRRILVGITHRSSERDAYQEQYVGTASVSDDGLVSIQCDDGETRDYPFDRGSLRRADPGQYRLRGTGQVVTNPDFLMIWIKAKD